MVTMVRVMMITHGRTLLDFILERFEPCRKMRGSW